MTNRCIRTLFYRSFQFYLSRYVPLIIDKCTSIISLVPWQTLEQIVDRTYSIILFNFYASLCQQIYFSETMFQFIFLHFILTRKFSWRLTGSGQLLAWETSPHSVLCHWFHPLVSIDFELALSIHFVNKCELVWGRGLRLVERNCVSNSKLSMFRSDIFYLLGVTV